MTDIEIVKAYVAAVERFDEAAALPLMHPEMRFHEMPNRIRPGGGVDDVAAMRAGLRKAGEGQVLRGQRYMLNDVLAGGDGRVVAQARWEGVVAIPLGRLQPGDTMVAHICMLFRLSDGRIIEQVNYDCYEDFGA